MYFSTLRDAKKHLNDIGDKCAVFYTPNGGVQVWFEGLVATALAKKLNQRAYLGPLSQVKDLPKEPPKYWHPIDEELVQTRITALAAKSAS